MVERVRGSRKGLVKDIRVKGVIARILFSCLFVIALVRLGFWWSLMKRNSIHLVKDLKRSERPLLLFETEMHLTGLNSTNIAKTRNIKDTERLSTYSGTIHKILWYNLPKWIHLEKLNKLWKRCTVSNCEHTSNKSLIKESSAVVFCTSIPGLSGDPPLQPSERPDKQVWVLFGLESPATQKVQYDGYIPTWSNSINWSMSYRLDTDIVMPYGYLETRTESVELNYSEIFRQKTKLAAWIVSKCRTPGRREEFVKKLTQHGLPVDIYGRCGTQFKDDPHILVNRYKFYLSFENSLCSDYVTEKFFKYYHYSTILVVRGGADYKRLLPTGTYIDTARFKSIEDLVNYLKYIGNSEALYTEYLRRKDKYKSIGNIKDTHLPYCTLCDKLNNMGAHRKIFESVPTYLETCYPPNDIN